MTARRGARRGPAEAARAPPASRRRTRPSSRRRNRPRRGHAASRTGGGTRRWHRRFRSRNRGGRACASRSALLVLRRRAPALRLLRLRRRGRVPEAGLQVVEDEADGGIRDRRGCDQAVALADDEDAAVGCRRLDLGDRRLLAAQRVGLLEQPARGRREALGSVAALKRRALDGAVGREEDGRLDLRGDLRQVGEGLRNVHGRRLTACQTAPVRLRKRALVTKFFADRGTHLAAMVAYFALLSFVPLVFLALALLGLAHRADASDFLVRELSRAFPGTSLKSIITLLHRVQDNAATLGIVGAVALLWSSLSLFSALESAFNIVYGVANRSFLRGKALAATLMVATVTMLFVSLLIGAVGVEVVKRYVPGFVGNSVVAYTVSILVSLFGIFLFLVAVYWLLPTADVKLYDALPGALLAALV